MDMYMHHAFNEHSVTINLKAVRFTLLEILLYCNLADQCTILKTLDVQTWHETVIFALQIERYSVVVVYYF